MGSMHCRLYDENLVHNIIISAGLSVFDFLKDHRTADSNDVCDYLELNVGSIIEDTIEQLNSTDDYPEKDDENGPWPLNTEE